MFIIGCHLSAAKGFKHMLQDALSIEANTFQFFTRNPRGGAAKEIDETDLNAFLRQAKEQSFYPILAHAPYTLNPASCEERIRTFASMVMADDFKRLERIPGSLYNLHPGSHVGKGVSTGIEYIAALLGSVLPQAGPTQVLLETMAGKGSEIGATFEELKQIIDQTPGGEKLGICFDTCHVYSAGYDIVSHLDDVLTRFDQILGLKRLKAVHLNDSLTPFQSHKDRHAQIGAGTIGSEALVRLVTHPALKDKPFYLETPNDLSGWAKEIRFFRQAVS